MKHTCVVLLLVLALCGGARPATVYVDDNALGKPNDGSAQAPYYSVQQAIDAAGTGDTIIVAPGYYPSPDPWAYAELQFKGKSVRVVSSKPTDFTVVDQTVLRVVVIFQGDEDPNCLLQGFKIQNYNYGGILGNKTQATISHCIISGNGPCGATVVKDVRGGIVNCLIVDNTTFHDCGVLPVVSGCPRIINCTIANNLSGVEIANAGFPETTFITIHNCIIWGNQGSQVVSQWDRTLPTTGLMDYSLIDNWNTMGLASIPHQSATMQEDGDPCFVRLGYWTDGPIPQPGATPRATRGGGSATLQKALIEGDYHLQSEGWRWSPKASHGSNWYYDTATSPAVSAGDPMDSLGEEVERAPADPEGRLGYNHAIELGAYGGTAQASLAPTTGEVPGVGAVDLEDYWPLRGYSEGRPIGSQNQWFVHNPQGTAWRVAVTGGGRSTRNGITTEYYTLTTYNAPDEAMKVYCHYANRTLIMTLNEPTLSPPVPQRLQAQYPQFLVAGATIQAPYDPFAKAGSEYRSVLVVRGALADVLAGTSMNPTQFLAGSWSDVIALKTKNADGTEGDPIAIFARGFGPLLLAGQPIEGAIVESKKFGNTSTAGTSGTRATRG